MVRKNQNPSRKTNVHAKTTNRNRKSTTDGKARSLALAKKEIRTTRDYGCLMAALMTDVIEEKVSPTVLNAAVNAGRQMIKAAELNLKYSARKPVKNTASTKEPTLNLLTGEPE